MVLVSVNVIGRKRKRRKENSIHLVTARSFSDQENYRKDAGNRGPNMVQVRGIEDRLFPENSRLVQLSRVFMSLMPEEQSDIRQLYNAGQDL